MNELMEFVAPREGRVSRNQNRIPFQDFHVRRAPRGA